MGGPVKAKDTIGMFLGAVAVVGGMVVVYAGLPYWLLVPLLGIGIVGVSLVGR